MQAPVSMLKGVSGQANTVLILSLLVGLALVVSIKKATPSTAATKSAL
jgi:hypothetical protein